MRSSGFDPGPSGWCYSHVLCWIWKHQLSVDQLSGHASEQQTQQASRRRLDTLQLVMLLYSSTMPFRVADPQTSSPTLYWGASSASQHPLRCRSGGPQGPEGLCPRSPSRLGSTVNLQWWKRWKRGEREGGREWERGELKKPDKLMHVFFLYSIWSELLKQKYYTTSPLIT